jgi:hypothetical protein
MSNKIIINTFIAAAAAGLLGQIQICFAAPLLESNLQYGMSGKDVVTLQKYLAGDPEIYPEAAITGYFGLLTKNAVQRFQNFSCLDPTGAVDQKTLGKINALLAEDTGDSALIPAALLKKQGELRKLCNAGNDNAINPVIPSSTTLADTAENTLTLTRNVSRPDLSAWLNNHPNVAVAIKWQNRAAAGVIYGAPSPTDKISWINWTQSQKDDLERTYAAAYEWLASGAPAVPVDYNGLSDRPLNVSPNVSKDTIILQQMVSADYMWKLYIDQIGFSLALENSRQIPWSVTAYSENALRYLFDSSTMAMKTAGGDYVMGITTAKDQQLRANNLPETAFAPAMWTFGFMKSSGLIGSSKLETISREIEWMRGLQHFFGKPDGNTYDSIWQYRGFAPLSRIIDGTVDNRYPERGSVHWISGCRGSVGFMNATLRTVNIPVQPVLVCGHQLPYFVSEDKYLTHGDNPYDINFKKSGKSGKSLLIDAAIYREWFSKNALLNITNDARACANVGRLP